MMLGRLRVRRGLSALWCAGCLAGYLAEAAPSAADYPSIQAAIDANPGAMILIPEGEHRISEDLRITTDRTGLYGFGTIVQENPERAVLRIEGAAGVRIRDVTLTRAEGRQDATESGVMLRDCRGAVLDGVRVLKCKARQAAIDLSNCRDCAVRDCEVIDYKRIAVDDRTDSPHYGYAFHCIDGTGIAVSRCRNVAIQDNVVADYDLPPIPEIKEKHRLGTLTEGRKPTNPGPLGAGAVQSGYVNNWHQGSAVIVTASDFATVTGNRLENAAQGFDIHSDHVVCANNSINGAMIGVKATHGSRNLVIANNMISRVDLWGVLLNPGTGSHHAGGAPVREANVDGGTVVTGNIVTDFGYGNEYWNWGPRGSFAIALFEGQEDTEPPLRDVLIVHNIVYNTGRDTVIKDGQPVEEPPRYRYALYIGPWNSEAAPGPTFPQNVVVKDNILHPGTDGVSNVEL